jgi:glutathione synthase/RimK-type ligase-like ATP-grasp enzyme
VPLHLIVVDRKQDFKWSNANRVVVTSREYAKDSGKGLPSSTRVINLCRDYSYLSLGYYCSLVAEGRGQRVIPAVDAILDLNWKRLYQTALPEINDLVHSALAQAPSVPAAFSVHLYFGMPDDRRFRDAARRIFDTFRCPILQVDLRFKRRWEVVEILPLSIRDLGPEQEVMFEQALDRYTRAAWRQPKSSPPARYSIAVLHDPDEMLPPSCPKALTRFVKAGAELGLEVEMITRRDFGRLPEFDALFIRETTALDHHTYRFAKKAEAEGMPVIDDSHSILKCTNKIYLAELLPANNIPTPHTLILDRKQVHRVESELGFPAVLKIPDGSFSRGVFKANNAHELAQFADRAFKESDLVLAQEYMATPFDWRVGVLNRVPIFVCQYFMAKGHWQIVKHGDKTKKALEGGWRTMGLDQAPLGVITTAVKAASLIGDGLYGVDLKETEHGIYVVEINDNPNIEVGVEDAVLKDELYQRIMREFIRRLEMRASPQPANGRHRNGAEPVLVANPLT